MVCVAIVVAFAAVNVVAAFEYPPLLVNVAALAALLGAMVHNLADEGRLR